MSEVQLEQEQDERDIAPYGEPPADEPLSTESESVQIEGDDDDESDSEQESEQDGEPAPIDGDEADRQARTHSEAELEKLHRQIAKANEAHVAKIGRIMGDDATALIPCPVCMDFTAGLIFPPEVAPLPDAVQDRMKQLLGLNSWEDTPNAAWAQQCPDCKGHGEVKTGSFVLGKETTRCLNCGGDGWKNTRAASFTTDQGIPVPSETGPTIYGTEVANDPDVQHLREKGYTVIPPMNVTQG